MTHITELFPLSELEEAINERLVTSRRHPTEPYTIYNYTERCQYSTKYWNRVTLQCRGLIVADDGMVIARPFKKFFNHGQSEGPQVALDEEVLVFDKLDGSLGILYPTSEGYAIASRGAFESEQAVHATAVWKTRYADRWRPLPGVTYLFEIIYPVNRIVVDYGEMDDLVLLGAVAKHSGGFYSPEQFPNWPGPRAQSFAFETLADALAAPPRQNVEGYVVRNNAGTMVKIKQEDYLRLHKIISGLNERAVWEHMAAGKLLDELLAALPDEFHPWTRGVYDGLTDAYDRIYWAVEDYFSWIESKFYTTDGTTPYTRKQFAEYAKSFAYPGMLFAKLDGKNYVPMIWKALAPETNEIASRARTEEVA